MEGERKKKERKREGERGRNSFPTRQQKYHTSFSIDIISKDPLSIYARGWTAGKISASPNRVIKNTK